MTSFRFRLERVLELRRTQLEVEEAGYRERAAELAALDRSRAEVEAAGIRAEIEVREWSPVSGHELAALGSFRLHVRAREADLAVRRMACVRKLDEQRKAMLEARRRCRLLERLRERRLEEWQAESNRELEELAAESYLARWGREPSHESIEIPDNG